MDPMYTVYTTAGKHTVDGRTWRTTCKKDSPAQRCRTEVWGNSASASPQRLTSKQRWIFHTETYLPADRSAWKDNPLGGNGETGYSKQWKKGKRQFKTECDTATSGKNACRTYVQINPLKPVSDTRRLVVDNVPSDWALHSIVLFNEAA
ncbi:MAG: hypothetical protein Q3997_06905 [Propionibacteriaceae bacterium]|nr:hypothetical protein [Propionibacteriaceae bacterium]